MAAIGFDAAARRRGKARIELHHRGDQRRIDRPEEHAGRRRRDGVVHATERAIAEHAVTIEIVSQRHIKRLVEILQVPRRLADDQRAQYDERHNEEASCRRQSRQMNAARHCSFRDAIVIVLKIGLEVIV